MNEEEKRTVNFVMKYLDDDEMIYQITNEDIVVLLNLIDKENKVIDLMSEQLAGLTIFDNNKEEPLILGNKEEVKEYYFGKVEEDGKN